ncbi:hypothetical protein COO91_07121 [Nostoc flagelliforme CCNUN1]|uniref:Uncharacterized protein n=1 Tax=Nostoc flagelliforme CCNUN1 TaxID=2038116 RepID=A0A2K8T051_9NOSO|nr:hypothetical protein COO91_07121 [Nostoc flagelliforme CCNUN1]
MTTNVQIIAMSTTGYAYAVGLVVVKKAGEILINKLKQTTLAVA